MTHLRRPWFALLVLLVVLLYGLLQGFRVSLDPVAQGVLW
jgi:hypothetical protein